jgi:hypothetical protein
MAAFALDASEPVSDQLVGIVVPAVGGIVIQTGHVAGDASIGGMSGGEEVGKRPVMGGMLPFPAHGAVAGRANLGGKVLVDRSRSRDKDVVTVVTAEING